MPQLMRFLNVSYSFTRFKLNVSDILISYLKMCTIAGEPCFCKSFLLFNDNKDL